MSFPNDEARRAYFTEKLREKLKDPAFRKIEGFPIGEDEDILAPVRSAVLHGLPESVHRGVPEHIDELAQVAEKEVPPRAVHNGCERREVGRVVFRPCLSHEGSSQSYRPVCIALHRTGRRDPRRVQWQWNDGRCCSNVRLCRSRLPARSGNGTSEPLVIPFRSGANGVSSSATCRRSHRSFLPTTTSLSIYRRSSEVGTVILSSLQEQIGSMYETGTPKSRTKSRINFTLWSEVFRCQHCGGEVVFLEEGYDEESKKVKDDFPCPKCGATLTKRGMERVVETRFDPTLKKSVSSTKRKPIFINYSVSGSQEREET